MSDEVGSVLVPKGTRRKMILLLMIMTPGIPEYLTGSSPVTLLILDLPSFLLGLVMNLGLYSTGALLIREFMVKFGKGWASVLALGGAYGIMEEGVSVHTFFQASGSPVGILSVYGRYAGVNWVWALGLTVFHAVFSILLPILLLSVAYPSRSRERLLGRKGTVAVFSMYMTTVVFLNLLLNNSRPDSIPTIPDYIVFSALSIAFLAIGYILPPSFLSHGNRSHTGVRKFFLLGLVAFPLYTVYALIVPSVAGKGIISPLIDMAFYILANMLLLIAIVRSMPVSGNRSHKLALSAGLVAPLLAWAEVMEISGSIRFITIAVAIGVYMLYRLRRNVIAGTPSMDNISPDQ